MITTPLRAQVGVQIRMPWVSFGKQGWVSSRERRRLPLNTLADVLRSAFT
jgi:hypothetical protein